MINGRSTYLNILLDLDALHGRIWYDLKTVTLATNVQPGFKQCESDNGSKV